MPQFQFNIFENPFGAGMPKFFKNVSINSSPQTPSKTKTSWAKVKLHSQVDWLHQISILVEFFCVIIHIGSKNIVSLKKCWVWNFFSSKIFFGLKKFLAWKICSEKMFESRKIIELGKMFGFVRNLGSQKDWLLKYFQPWPVLTWPDFTCSHLTCPDLICPDLTVLAWLSWHDPSWIYLS